MSIVLSLITDLIFQSSNFLALAFSILFEIDFFRFTDLLRKLNWETENQIPKSHLAAKNRTQ